MLAHLKRKTVQCVHFSSILSRAIFKWKKQNSWKIRWGSDDRSSANQIRNVYKNRNGVYPSWHSPHYGQRNHGAFPCLTPPTVPVSKWTSCNKWIQIASASLNNGDYRVAEKTMGGKTNSVCEDPPIISIKRVQVGPTRVAIGRHQDMPVKIFSKRKLPILNQNMLIQIFYSGNCHLCTMFVRRDAK